MKTFDKTVKKTEKFFFKFNRTAIQATHSRIFWYFDIRERRAILNKPKIMHTIEKWRATTKNLNILKLMQNRINEKLY